jgi:hypothetical protein
MQGPASEIQPPIAHFPSRRFGEVDSASDGSLLVGRQTRQFAGL